MVAGFYEFDIETISKISQSCSEKFMDVAGYLLNMDLIHKDLIENTETVNCDYLLLKGNEQAIYTRCYISRHRIEKNGELIMKEKLRRNHIQVANEFMDNENYNNKEKFLVLLFRTLENDMTNAAPVCINHLLEMLSLTNDKKNKASLKETLMSMEEKGMMRVYKDLMCRSQVKSKDIKPANMYYIKSYVSDIPEEVEVGHSFTQISYEEMLKFMAMKERNKHMVFAVCFNIIRRIFKGTSNSIYAYPNITTIAEETTLDKKTVSKYIKVLKENELVEYVTVRIKYDKEKNYYCRWADREELKAIITEELNQQSA